MAFTSILLCRMFQKVSRGSRSDFLLLLLLGTCYLDTVSAFLPSSGCVSQSDRKRHPTCGFAHHCPLTTGFVSRKHTFSRHRIPGLEDRRCFASVRRGGNRLDLHASTEGYASESKAERFCQWLRDRGAKGVGPTVVVGCTAAGQYGLFAARDIAPGETVLSLPMETLSFSEESVVGHAEEAELNLCRGAVRAMYASGRFFSKSPQGDPLIAIQLLLELARGHASAYAPYLDVLPPLEHADAAWLWSEEEASALLSGPVAYFAAVTRRSVATEFEELVDRVFANHPLAFPAQTFTLQNYRWAKHVVMSRAYAMEGFDCMALLPGIDMANHRCDVDYNVRLARPAADEEEREEEEEEPDGQTACLVAERGYKEGEEVWISYGAKSNDQLLLAFGFTPPERNPHPPLTLTLLPDATLTSLRGAEESRRTAKWSRRSFERRWRQRKTTWSA